MKRTYKLLWWLNIIVAFFTLLSYLAPYINPQNIWQASFLGLAYPTLLWVNILFLALWSLTRKKYILLPILVILSGWSALRSYVGMSLNADNGNPLQDIRVLSYNTNALYHLRNEPTKPKRLAREAAFKKFIVEQEANILCLQEFPLNQDFIFQDSSLFAVFDKRITKTGTLLSKWPIVKYEAKYFPNSRNGYLWADIKTPQDTLRIFNVHLQSNSISKETDKVLADGVQKQETWNRIRSLLAQVNERTLMRVNQAKTIATMVEDSPYPVIIAGDFNNTPQSYAYKLLSKNLTDSFRERGFGIGTTYAGRIPSLRIDFILAQPSFEVINSKVVQVDFSDHYPVVSTFARKP